MGCSESSPSLGELEVSVELARREFGLSAKDDSLGEQLQPVELKTMNSSWSRKKEVTFFKPSFS